MPTRAEYEAYFEPLVGRELDDFSSMEQSQNEYEKYRNRNIRLSVDIEPDQQSRAEAMVAEMRRQPEQFVKNLAVQVQASQARGVPMKMPTFGDKEVPVSDLSYVLAESLQHLYSSEDPRAEYYDWVEIQRKIEVDINTNGTTDDEIKARNLFIGFLDDRETELKLIISLYSTAERNGTGYYKEMAQNKLNFLYFKLSELRRLRDRTQATKDKSDEQERREQELERSAQIMAAGMAGVSLAAGMMQNEADIMQRREAVLARHNYIQNQKAGEEFDSAIEGVMTHYRPVTRTFEEVMSKKETLVNNKRSWVKTINGLRMGQSVEMQEKEQSLNEQRTLVRRSRSFSVNRFYALERERSLSA